ncbi:MAG: glycosyltransferase family 4 protein [Candidatus Dojkabacteria bacterium]|nr:glycosyltransferase family 4 protein [Candidatus Dojkabacteria bacterium]
MHQQLKIGYLIKYFHPIKGGAENNILNIARRSAEQGFEVHVFTSDRKGNERCERSEEEYEGIKIHRSKTWFDFTHYLGFYPSLIKNLLKYDLDVIHVSGFGFMWHDCVLILKKMFSRKTKFICTPHGPFMALQNYNIILKTLKFTYTAVQKLFLNWLYDAVIQVNTFQWQWILRYGIKKKKVFFVPNGVSSQVLNTKVTDKQKTDFKRKYDLQNKFVISSLGRIDEYKGIQFLVEILPDLIEIRKDLVLLIMGRDEGYVRNLKAQISKLKVKDYVRFIVNVSEDEKFVGLELAEIFYFGSQWEAFGLVLLEAMAHRSAFISTKTEGGNFLTTEGVNGFLFDFGDTDKLCELMEILIEDEKKRIAMQSENLDRVKKYTWGNIYIKYYLPVLDFLSNKRI